MSVSWIAIAKLGGPIVDRCVHFLQEISESTDSMNGSMIQRRHIRKDATDRLLCFIHALEKNAVHPTVLHYQKYVDPWSLPAHHLALETFAEFSADLVHFDADDINVVLLKMERVANIQSSLESVLRAVERQERRDVERHEFLVRIKLATTAWQDLVTPSAAPVALLMVFQTVAPSWLDKDVLKSVETAPTWIFEV